MRGLSLFLLYLVVVAVVVPCFSVVCKYRLVGEDSLESVSKMFHVELNTLEKANEKTHLGAGVEVLIPKCSHLPVCIEPGKECDISWLKEDACVRGSQKKNSVYVSCAVVGQVCSSLDPISCHSEMSRCGNPCKESLTDGKCGEDVELDLDSSSNMHWPVPSSMSVIREFGLEDEDSSCGFHTALDIAADEKAAIVAVMAGKVVHVGQLWVSGASYGRGDHAIVVEHGKGVYSVYSHNRKSTVSKGICVEAGQVIGEVGSEGYAKGISHLHFELLQGTKYSGNWAIPFDYACTHYKDPMKYFKLT